MKKELWVPQAQKYNGMLLSNQHEELYMQMSAWNNTIGNSPFSLGGEYMTLWETHRVNAPDEGDLFKGKW
jgi:hypothetical protein